MKNNIKNSYRLIHITLVVGVDVHVTSHPIRDSNSLRRLQVEAAIPAV